MAPTEDGSLVNHLMDRQSDRGVVGANHGPGTDAYDDVDRNLVSQDLTKHAEMRDASQASCTEYDSDPETV
jgi:hypothetical protein